MTPNESATVDRQANENALRDTWYARVLVEQGRRIPGKVELSNSATARPSRTSRQDKVSA